MEFGGVIALPLSGRFFSVTQGKCHKSVSVLKVSKYEHHKRMKSQYYSLYFSLRDPQEAIHSVVKVFVGTTQVTTTEGKTLFVPWILLLQFICLHVWSATLFNFPWMVLPGMYSHCWEINFSWPFRYMWLISFPQWYLLSEVSAEIKQLSWIISDLHISANHLTPKNLDKIFKILISFSGICYSLLNRNVSMSLKIRPIWGTKPQTWEHIFGFQLCKFWPLLVLAEKKNKSGKTNDSSFFPGTIAVSVQ